MLLHISQKAIAFQIILVLASTFLSANASHSLPIFSAETLQSNNSTSNCIWVPDDYATITEAIFSAQNGTVICLRSGKYIENIFIDKPVSIIGEGTTSIIDGNQTANVVTIEAPQVYLSQLTITNSGKDASLQRNSGIFVKENKCAITEVTFTSNAIGLTLTGASETLISQCVFTQNVYGIWLNNSDDNCISNCIFSECDQSITQVTGHNNVFANNTLKNNRMGIVLGYSTNNTIKNNSIFNNYYAIEFIHNLKGNNLIKGNIISRNVWALWFLSANYERIVENTIEENNHGIDLLFSNNNQIWRNNIINNTVQASITECQNAWNDTYNYGNYWSDYCEKDVNPPYGIGDNVKAIDTQNIDYHPLLGILYTFPIHEETEHLIDIISNSYIIGLDFNRNAKQLIINLNTNNPKGFCRIAIPRELLDAPFPDTWQILISEEEILENFDIKTNHTHSFLYFQYDSTVANIRIQGTTVIREFPSFLLFLFACILTVLITLKTAHKRLLHNSDGRN